MYFFKSRSISKVNRDQRKERALVIKIGAKEGTREQVSYYELLFPKVSLNDLELEAAVHIGDSVIEVSEFIRCSHEHLYALKPVRLSRLTRPYEIIAEYDSMTDPIIIDPNLYRKAWEKSRQSGSITYLEYRRRRRDNKLRWLTSYLDKLDLWKLPAPRDFKNDLPIGRLATAWQANTAESGKEPSAPAITRTFTEWHRLNTEPKRRPGRRRKERLPLAQWFGDYFRAFRSTGWQCLNKGISTTRIRLTPDELRDVRSLIFQNGRTAVGLFPSVTEVGEECVFCAVTYLCRTQPDTVVRIVRGRRPDVTRGICRQPDGTATKVIPDDEANDVFSRMVEPPPDKYSPTRRIAKFCVDFDGELFEPTTAGTWQSCTDEKAKEVYAAYLAASSHHQSFRGYQKPKVILPHDPLPRENMSNSLLSVGQDRSFVLSHL